ncbi:6-phosphogluconolactonase [Azospirillum canadense]|uniref:6-phosphogluconolactonase n=1 Tax=Azospirillum canadense TaxID=403962 RepID=UPI002226BF1D|nr:6-phosphogluconolactonase [Azospirillum canadense]MCW2239796.1 6-phosphogluconolactonase [Azospirillum canadense]
MSLDGFFDPDAPQDGRRSFASADALVEALAASLAARLRGAIAARGSATLVVSGGRTPEALFRQMSDLPLDWAAVTVTLADERWVPPDDPDSNEALVRRSLLVGPAAAARFVGLYTGADTPEAGEDACDARIRALSRPFDAVLLGMGDDGHTASFFPGAANLAAALSPVEGRTVQAIRAPGIPQPRMTLTLPTLLDTQRLLLLITGDSKRRTLELAEGEGPVEAMPVRSVLRQDRVPLEIFWAP